MPYTIYQTTNILNNYIYVGVHKTRFLDDGYLGSGVRIRYLIKKYGAENFKKDILFVFETANEAFNKEAEIVDEEFLKREDTYNLRTGGVGRPQTSGKFHAKGKQKKLKQCPHCLEWSPSNSSGKYHFDNCVHESRNLNEEELSEINIRRNPRKYCQFCKNDVTSVSYRLCHGPFCKMNPDRIMRKPISEDTRAKMSKKKKGITLSQEKLESRRNAISSRSNVVCEFCNIEFSFMTHQQSHGRRCKHHPDPLPKQFHSEETKAKMSMKAKGIKKSAETIAKMSKAQLAMDRSNRVVTQETRDKLSKSSKGRKMSESTKALMSIKSIERERIKKEKKQSAN